MEMTMHIYAQIDSGRRAFAITQTNGPLEGADLVELATYDPELIGKVHNLATGEWEAPEAVEDPRVWWVDVGPFKDRLGMDAPAIYASTHDACKGVVGMVEGRKYIDLRDPRIAAMMGVLIATAQPAANPVWPGSGPMTAAKRDAILTTLTTEVERHVKGLEG
jgi:hypothetical protein